MSYKPKPFHLSLFSGGECSFRYLYLSLFISFSLAGIKFQSLISIIIKLLNSSLEKFNLGYGTIVDGKFVLRFDPELNDVTQVA